MDSSDPKLLVLIESVSNLSRITANHDVLLTKLVDDHEMRIRGLEKCSVAMDTVDKYEARIRVLENWKWYVAGIALGMSILTGVVLKLT